MFRDLEWKTSGHPWVCGNSSCWFSRHCVWGLANITAHKEGVRGTHTCLRGVQLIKTIWGWRIVVIMWKMVVTKPREAFQSKKQLSRSLKLPKLRLQHKWSSKAWSGLPKQLWEGYLINQSIAISAAAAGSSGHLLYVLLLVRTWKKVTRAFWELLQQQPRFNSRGHSIKDSSWDCQEKKNPHTQTQILARSVWPFRNSNIWLHLRFSIDFI